MGGSGRPRTWLLSLALVGGWLLAAAAPARGWAAEPGLAPAIIGDVPYPGAARGDRRRSLDLYLPADRAGKPPLLIFVHGGFWMLDDEPYRIGPSLAEALVREGVAVALLRYRLAPAATHPAQAEDVAAGVALLVREAKQHGYDPGRIFLAGHSAGGHLAALVALDPRYLGRHGVSPQSLAGVIAFSGIYDLSARLGVAEERRHATERTFGTNPAVLADASPTRHVRADAPPFLILSAEDDVDFIPEARALFDALARAGHNRVDRWIVPERDHFTLMNLADPTNDARILLLDFLKVAPLPPDARMLADARRRWRDPPFSTLPFWRYGALIRSHPVDPRFIARLLPIFAFSRFELLEWPLQTFHAIGLFDFLAALPPDRVGRGRHLVITNVRNERQFWTREQIAPYEPVIVIGLDDEKNLFRLGVFYRALREYSWKTGPQPPMMARPVGAFIHFLKEPPPGVAMPQASQFALTEDSFRLVGADPLATLKDLRKDVYDTVTVRNGCVYCHTLRGVGSRSQHVTADAGTPHGGAALPLESYPPTVWKAFIFDQAAVARKIGASPNPVAEGTQQALYDLVNRARRPQDRAK
jgi:acetyl esterase/lipase